MTGKFRTQLENKKLKFEPLPLTNGYFGNM